MGELKEVLFYVNDGKFDSNFASAYVTISTRNDAPVITLGQDGTVDISLMYLEDQSEPLLPAQYIRINGIYHMYAFMYMRMYACMYVRVCVCMCTCVQPNKQPCVLIDALLLFNLTN